MAADTLGIVVINNEPKLLTVCEIVDIAIRKPAKAALIRPIEPCAATAMPLIATPTPSLNAWNSPLCGIVEICSSTG